MKNNGVHNVLFTTNKYVVICNLLVCTPNYIFLTSAKQNQCDNALVWEITNKKQMYNFVPGYDAGNANVQQKPVQNQTFVYSSRVV